MPDDERVPPTVEAALAQIQGSIDAGFERINGQLALLMQRADQTDRGVEALTKAKADLDTRVRVIETTMASRERVDAVESRFDGVVTKDEVDQKQRRTIGWVSVIVSVAALLASAAFSLANTLA